MDDSEPEGINRKGAAEPQPSRSDRAKASTVSSAERRKGARCHFDRREKSFSNPSHPLGMTDLGPSLSVAIIRLSDCSPCATNC